jgi:hypothetical protein
MTSVAITSKQLIQEYFNALSGQPKTAMLMDLYISDSGLQEHIRVVETAFPEYEIIPDLIVAESDLVAARCTFRGVHKGEFAGVQPTGKIRMNAVSPSYLSSSAVASRSVNDCAFKHILYGLVRNQHRVNKLAMRAIADNYPSMWHDI